MQRCILKNLKCKLPNACIISFSCFFIYTVLFSYVGFSKPKNLNIESIHVEGSSRIDAKKLVSEFGLYRDMELSQVFAKSIMTRLLGMGLFEKANLLLEKGSQKGKAKLNFKLQDDPSVVGSWAIGTNLQLRFTETQAAAFDFEGSPLNIKAGIIARNAFNSLHRLGVDVEVNSNGELTEISAAWGLPKFSKSQTQFDVGFQLKRASNMYLDVYGFAIDAYGIWSLGVADGFHFRYGIAGLANRAPLFALPYYPNTILGPYVEIGTTTTFGSFLGDNGYNLVLRLIPSVGRISDSYVRLDLNQTFSLFTNLKIKYGGIGYLVGDKGYGARLEVRMGHPFGGKFGKFITDTSEVFIRGRYGRDWLPEEDIIGYDGTIGVRLFSRGFIGELGFKILQIPSKKITTLFSGD